MQVHSSGRGPGLGRSQRSLGHDQHSVPRDPRGRRTQVRRSSVRGRHVLPGGEDPSDFIGQCSANQSDEIGRYTGEASGFSLGIAVV